MITDPCARQVSDGLLILIKIVEGIGIHAGHDETFVRDHDPLGFTSGSRGVKDDAKIAGFKLIDTIAPTCLKIRITHPGIRSRSDHEVHRR